MPKVRDMLPNTGRYFDETGAVRNVVEQVTGGFVGTESDHTSNHLGYGYNAHMEVANLAAGQSKSWCWTGPATLFAHLKNFSLTVLGSSGRLELLRGAAVTVNTGAVVPLNNTNDNSENLSQSELRADPTYTGGVMWDKVLALADSTNQNIGSAQFQSTPFVELVTANENTNYVFKLTNIGADNMVFAGIKVFFYEEPRGLIQLT